MADDDNPLNLLSSENLNNIKTSEKEYVKTCAELCREESVEEHLDNINRRKDNIRRQSPRGKGGNPCCESMLHDA